MIGVKLGFVTQVKNEWLHVTSSHFSLHRYTLASKTLSLHLMEVLDVAVKVIMFLRSRAKNHPFYQLLAKETGAQEEGLLFYTKQPVGCGEANASLGCMNLKMRLESFFEKTKRPPCPISQCLL